MSVLDRIKSDEFILSIGYELPPSAMYSIFVQLEECAQFRTDYKSGAISDSELRSYINTLLLNFRIGESFLYSETLALMAVGLESFYTDFAEEFLSDLSKLKLIELHISVEIANICLKNREKRPSNNFKNFSWIAAIDVIHSFEELKSKRPWLEAGQKVVRYEYEVA